MTKKYGKGLVVGKFNPPHRGHQYIIDTAIEQCEELVVLVLSKPDAEKFNSRQRAWLLNKMYGYRPNSGMGLVHPVNGCSVYITAMQERDTPHNRDSHWWQREAVRIYLEELTILGLPEVVFTSEEYGEGFAQHLGCEHVLVDMDRKKFPISATEIRRDPYAQMGYLDPMVQDFYRDDYIEKVVFMGAESTGKTTLAERMADEYQTRSTYEYGRDLCVDVDHRLTTDHMAQIVLEQESLEDNLVDSGDCKHYLFCDTCAVTTEFYSYEYNNECHPVVSEAAARCPGRYPHVILCGDDIPFEDDGVRRLSGGMRTLQQKMIRMQLDWHGMKYVEVNGPLEERVKFLKTYLDEQKRLNYHRVD